MGKEKTQLTLDPEIEAINAVVTAIRNLDTSMQQNVIDYVVRRFNLRAVAADEMYSALPPAPPRSSSETQDHESQGGNKNNNSDEGLEGISPVARKWMSRNGLSSEGLSKYFSLGIEEIDLVAKKVPGKSKRDRMRSVILLKGIAGYLGSGVARVSHEQVKEACVHYDAFDTTNFATYLKQLSAEVGVTKETGYTLTARGLSAATELLTAMLNPSAK